MICIQICTNKYGSVWVLSNVSFKLLRVKRNQQNISNTTKQQQRLQQHLQQHLHYHLQQQHLQQEMYRKTTQVTLITQVMTEEHEECVVPVMSVKTTWCLWQFKTSCQKKVMKNISKRMEQMFFGIGTHSLLLQP